MRNYHNFICTTVATASFVFSLSQAIAQTSEEIETTLGDRNPERSENFKLDIAVPTAPGLILAGASNFETVTHDFGTDLAMSLSQSGSGKPNGSFSLRPYPVFGALTGRRGGLKDENSNKFTSALERTQISLGVASIEKDNQERAAIGFGAVFYPLSSSDPRMDPILKACLHKVAVDDFNYDKAKEKSYVQALLGDPKDPQFDKNFKKLVALIAEATGLPKETFGDFGGWFFDDFIADPEPLSAKIGLLISEYLTNTKGFSQQDVQSAEEKIFILLTIGQQAHKLKKPSGKTELDSCIKPASNRYLNQKSWTIGVGTAAKSPDAKFSRIKSTGLNVWTNFRIPLILGDFIPNNACKKDSDIPCNRDRKKPAGALVISARYADQDKVLVAKDVQETAKVWTFGAEFNIERDRFVFKTGAAQVMHNFRDTTIANEDFLRIAAGLDVKLNDDIWWTLEAGDIAGTAPFGEGSYFKSGLKFSGPFASLSSAK